MGLDMYEGGIWPFGGTCSHGKGVGDGTSSLGEREGCRGDDIWM